MRMRSAVHAILGILVLASGGAARAAGSFVDISSAVNSNLATYTGGTTYPLSDTNVTIGGIDFDLAPFFPNDPMSPAGVVQSGNGAPTSITIDIADIALGTSTTFYSIVNSAFGVAPNTVGNLTFNLASGGSIVYALTEGDNLRDHYNGIYNNVAPNVYGTAVYGDDRLDAQQIVIGSQFAGDTVTSITLNNTDPGDGNPFLAALTVTGAAASAVPEPAAWALMLAGFGVLGGAMRRTRGTGMTATRAVA